MQPIDYINYYRACYQADNRALTLQNINARRVEHQYWAEAFAAADTSWQVPADWWTEVAQQLEVYAREKELVGCYFFIINQRKVAGKTRTNWTPLLFQRMQPEREDGKYWLEPLSDYYQLNPAVLQILATNADVEDPEQYLIDNLPLGDFNESKIGRIAEVLQRVFMNLETKELANFPIIFSNKMIERLERTKTADFTIVPAVAFGLVRKSVNTRDQLNDLAELAASSVFSNPLLSVLGQPAAPVPPFQMEDTYIPATLSVAQQNIIQSVVNNWLTVAIGPPGTGKSFTIAATALDAITKGRSVLICSQNYQALEVVARKLRADFKVPQVAVEAGRKDWKKEVRKHLEQLLNGYGFAPEFADVNKTQQQNAENEIRATRERIANWETKRAERLLQEQEWAEKLNDNDNLTWWRRWYRSWLMDRIKKQLPLHDIYANVQRLEKINLRNIEHLLQLDYYYYLRQTLTHHRREIKRFLKAIRSRTGMRREAFFEAIEFEVVLSAFPIWLVSFADLNRVLPQTKDLFELVIIDEASQCDMASALPALQRAKRALVVGDPQQLRHVSFLPRQRQQLLAQNFGLPPDELEEELNFRSRSLLDLALENVQQQQQVHLLNEHFRSHPRLIQFSNEQFYKNALRLMTQTPGRSREEAVFIKHIADGKRVKRGYNKNEGEALIFFLRLRITDEKNLSADRCSSIGILSPFREQVNWLQRNIESGFSLTELSRHQILVGTAHDFQGEERDLMFLSFALDDASPAGAFRFLNRADVFNVSITRARHEIYLFKSFTPSKLSRDYLIAKYLDYVENYRPPKASNTAERDAAVESIITHLRPRLPGRILANYTVAGISLDILLWQNDTLLAIDLIAFAGAVGAALTTHQIQMLGRVGVEVFPLAYSEWVVNRAGVMELIRGKLGRG